MNKKCKVFFKSFQKKTLSLQKIMSLQRLGIFCKSFNQNEFKLDLVTVSSCFKIVLKNNIL